MKKLLKSKPALITLAVCILLLGIGGASGSDNQELKDQLAQVTAELDTETSQNEELSQQIQDLSSEVDDLSTKNEELQASLDQANEQIAKLSSLEDQQAVIDDLNSQIQDLKKRSNSSSTAATSSETVQEAPTSTSYTVYITKTGEKYHRDGCRYLKKSQIAIDKNDAVARGYTPCSVCNP